MAATAREEQRQAQAAQARQERLPSVARQERLPGSAMRVMRVNVESDRRGLSKLHTSACIALHSHTA